MNYAEMIFLKDIEFNEDFLFYAAYLSVGYKSGLKRDFKKLFDPLKKYKAIEILQERHKSLYEGYSEHNFIVKANDNIYFLRVLLINELIYDILIYEHIDVEYIKKIFFASTEDKIPEALEERYDESKNNLIVERVNNKYVIRKASKSFYKIINYEDWDYKNKYQNIIDFFVKEYDESKATIISKGGEEKNISVEYIIDGEFLLINIFSLGEQI